MRGSWLTAVARRLLHAGTFDLVVSPAVADLQFEGRGYRAVLAAIAGAVCLDLATDIRDLYDDAPMLMTLIGIQTTYFSMLMALMQAMPKPHAAVLILMVAVTCSISTLLLFWPRRRA